MPGGDGTGPYGQGPIGGRRLGRCFRPVNREFAFRGGFCFRRGYRSFRRGCRFFSFWNNHKNKEVI